MKIAFRSLILVAAAAVCACTKSETQTPATNGTPAANETPQAPANETPANQTPVVETPKVEAPKAETPAPVAAAPTSGPVGTWALDGAGTFEANRATIEGSLGTAPEEEKAMVMNMMTEMFNAMSGTLTLNADNSLTGSMSMANPMTGAADVTTMTGSWAANGDSYTITTREEGKDKDEVNAATIDGDMLKFVADEGGQPMTLVFKRQG
jgi:hypothetical protein